MPKKATGEGSFDPVHQWDGGTTWIAHPDEAMERASHALVVQDGVWVVDPVDATGLDDRLAALGTVAGVVVLLDRHTRDAGDIATRHDVPVVVPDWMDGIADDIDATVETFGTTVADTYSVYPLATSRFWQEAALYDEDSGTLVVPETVGTASFFRTGSERLGVHPVKRLRPPRRLREFDPDRVLVGHGEPVTDGAAAALRDALHGARRRAPRLYASTLREFVFG